MTSSVPFFVEVITAILLLSGAAITLIGTLGLLRLDSFYRRIHAPTLGTSFGTVTISVGSMIYFSVLGGRLALHELLIIFFITVTTPISLMVLVRAAVFRDGIESGEPLLRREDSKG